MIYYLKKLREKPMVVFDVICRRFYSYLSYFFYKISLKKFGLRSFIHPLASISNHGLISIGKNVMINRNVTIWGGQIEVGDGCQINPNSVVYGNAVIGENVMIGPNCMIAGGNHGFSDVETPMILQLCNSKGIVIEDDVWIGANCVILDGVKVSKGSIIGAGSVVTKSISSFSIAYGNPCKIIKRR